MKVFLAIKSIDGVYGYHVLGLYKSLETAKQRCLVEPSFSKQGWIECDNSNQWHNGGGLNISIQEAELNN